jgi:signal transduction histidine kinase/ActR/RegA family two-component response regulator
MEVDLVSKDGRTIPALFSASVFGDREDRVGGMIITAKDITERKGMEEALRRAHDELEQHVRERTAELHRAYESLQRQMLERSDLENQLRQSQKMEAVGRLAGGVAHDFNNQLAVIRGYVEMILDDVPDGTRLHTQLSQIEEAVRRSADLTEQLLLFTSKQPVNIRPVDLNACLMDLEGMLRPLLGEDIVVQMDLADDLWAAKADPGNISQVVTNLAVNARDAMPEGGTLTFTTLNVDIDDVYCRRVPEARPGSFVCVTVCDTGVGMDEAVRTRLFEPFFTTKGLGKGTGLGLSLVYGMVQAHEGWIVVESQPGQGSRFAIHLPSEGREAAAGRSDVEPGRRRGPQGRGERILLVEDEPALREMTHQFLAENGYLVRPCSTVGEATEIFRQEKVPFDLILSDVVLPDGRGTDLVFDFLGECPDLAAVLVTGYTDERGDWQRAREAGLSLLQKPVEMAVLLDYVQRALKTSSAR